MSQQNIDFGSFPNDPSADPIRAAFQKIQDNFTELYNQTLTAGVSNVYAGPGLYNVGSRTYGNVEIASNIPNITIQTANSLLVGVGAATSNTATVSAFNTPFVLNLAPTITTGNANLSGNLRTSNLNVSSFVTSNLVPNAGTYELGSSSNRWATIYANSFNVGTQTFSSNSTGITMPNVFVSGNVAATGNISANNISVANFVGSALVPNLNEVYDLGTPTRRWRDLYLSANSLKLGSQTITASNTGVVIDNIQITSNLSAGNVSATFVAGQLTSSNQPSITSVGVLQNLQVAGNLATGEMQVIGNLQVTKELVVTGAFQATTITGNVVVPPGANLAAPGSNGQIMFNDAGNSAAVPGLSFDKSSNLLSISGNVSGGNIVTSGAIQGNTATVNSLSANFVTTSGNISGANLISLGVISASGNLSAGNLTTSGFLNVVGNASVGNITTTNILGQVITVSGNVSGANLIASGFMQVDGNANVGNLTTSGIVSAATISASANISAGNLSTGGNLNVTGNATVGNLTANGFSATGNISAGNLATAGGLTVTGNASVGNLSTGNFSANGNLTAANLATAGGLSVTGNASVGNLQTALLIASGALSAASLTTSGALSAGNAALGNITSVGLVSATGNVTAGNLGTGGTLAVAGNATVGNVSTTSIVMNGNLTGAALMESGLMNVTGNMTSGNVITNGFLSVAGTATMGNVTTVAVEASGNVVAGNFTTSGGITSNTADISTLAVSGLLNAATANADINRINSNVLSVVGTANAGNLETGGTLSVSGNATTGNFQANGSVLANGQLVVQSSATIATQLGVGANLSLTNISGNGTVVTASFAAQSSVPFPAGASVTISGVTPTNYNGTFIITAANTSAASFSSSVTGTATVLGRIRTSGTILEVRGNANVTNLNVASFVGTEASLTNLTFATSGILSLQNGSANIGSLTANLLAVTGNLSGANLSTSGILSVQGNASLGNANLSGVLSVVGSMAAGNLSTGGTLSVTGNASVGNLSTTAITASSGNINGTFTATLFSGNGASLTNISGVQVTGTVGNAANAVSVTGSSQPSITSVGTLTGLTLSGALSGTNVSTSGYMISSVSSGIVAAGTALSTATLLTRQVNVVSTVAPNANDGVRLPATTVGLQVIVINASGFALKVYPPNGSQVDGLGLNTPFNLGPGARVMVVATSTTQWYTMLGVYA